LEIRTAMARISEGKKKIREKGRLQAKKRNAGRGNRRGVKTKEGIKRESKGISAERKRGGL